MTRATEDGRRVLDPALAAAMAKDCGAHQDVLIQIGVLFPPVELRSEGGRPRAVAAPVQIEADETDDLLSAVAERLLRLTGCEVNVLNKAAALRAALAPAEIHTVKTWKEVRSIRLNLRHRVGGPAHDE